MTETMECHQSEVSALDAGSDVQPSADGRTRILVVDDFFIERRFAGSILTQEPDIVVDYAVDGQDALAAIERHAPSAIVTDLQMPGLDGLQLVERVRARFPQIPVILMTGQGSEDTAMQALRAGAASYLPKKSLRQDLVTLVRQVLNLAATDRKRRRLFGSMTRWRASFELENDQELHAPLVDLLQEQFKSMRLGDAAVCMQVGIALMEALANALYHGNLEVSSDLRQQDESLFYGLAATRRGQEPYKHRRIQVDAQCDDRRAEFVVRDSGPGFDTSVAEKPLDPDDFTRIGGRGLLLIRSFMDEVRYNSTGNELTLRKFRADGSNSRD